MRQVESEKETLLRLAIETIEWTRDFVVAEDGAQETWKRGVEPALKGLRSLSESSASEPDTGLRAAAREVWDSVPASYDEDDPMVQRHARALNALGAVLSRSEPDTGHLVPENEALPMGERDCRAVLAWWQEQTWKQGARAERAEEAMEAVTMGRPVDDVLRERGYHCPLCGEPHMPAMSHTAAELRAWEQSPGGAERG